MKIKLTVLFLCILFVTNVYAQKGFPFDNEIRAFKKADSLSFPPKNAILFIGSSSIRKWTDLEQRFAGRPIIRRGVGGSELWQLVSYYTPYIIFPYHPSKIFLYDGENDIAISGKNSEFVLHQLQQLLDMIKDQLPRAKVYYMSIKPCPGRAKCYAEIAKTNELIKIYFAKKPKRKYKYIDLTSVIQNSTTGLPDSSLFERDYIHLNSKGYDKWQKVLTTYMN